jgi:ABC-type uncharacterized transport system substrate-binding protein
MARELVENKVDVIIAVNGIGAKEAEQTSRTIPIIYLIGQTAVSSNQWTLAARTIAPLLSRPSNQLTGTI